MRLTLLVLLVLPAMLSAFSLSHYTQDPCDQYGNCVSSSISYVRANPDHSLYLGDSFSIPISIIPGPNTTGYSLSWSYDSSIFAKSGDTFIVIGNKTGSFLVTVAATFTGSVTAGNSTRPFSSTLTVGESVKIIQLVISPHLQLVNVTGPQGRALRNPEGSFFRNDSFCAMWNASFQFSDARTDILINATGSLPAFLRQVSSNYTGSTPGRQGFACYDIALAAPYSNGTLPLNFNAINWQGASIAHVIAKVPFAVVQYSPVFSKYTYTDYNSSPSNAYQKPFVTLVRYGGNDPGYSYRGDNNTKPIINRNDTGERAWTNNFTFSNQAWRVQFAPSSSSIAKNLNFTGMGSANVTIRPANSTFNLITWPNRVQKYYFFGKGFDNYTAKGTVYFNVTERAFSKDFAGGTYPLYNTTYLYQPVYYNGRIVFQTFDSGGNPDPSIGMNITIHNPSPLDPYLVSQVERVFGNDSRVLRAFKTDLYSAYNTTQALKPQSVLNGTWTYLVNQTNIGFLNAPLPYFSVTVAGHGRTFTYSFNDSFSVFLLDNKTLSALPFENVTSYYIDAPRGLLALPLAFGSASHGSSFIVFSYRTPFFADPSASSSFIQGYGLIYGVNSTVPVNLDGGGVVVLGGSLTGTSYSATLAVPSRSGGVSQFWVKDPQGRTVVSQLAGDTTSPPSPCGFLGFYLLQFYPLMNGTYTIGVTNSLGVSSVVYTTPNISTPPPQWPTLAQSFIELFVVIVLGFYFLGLLLHGRRTKEP